MADETKPTGTESGAAAPPAIDYDKIESMIIKGTQQKESAILKSYFEQLGMSSEEVQAAVQDFKSKRDSQANEKETNYANAQQEIAQLKAQILQDKIDRKANDMAMDLGVERSAVPYVIRMADLTNAVNDKGEISEDAIKAALEKVLTDVPGLKSDKTRSNGFVRIGGSGSNTQTTAQNEVLANIFGTNRKKGSN